MKHLKEYILESLSYKIYTFVKTLKCDFRDAKDNYEKYFIDIFNNASDKYNAKLLDDSSIIISNITPNNKDNDSMSISLKVGDSKVIGTPDMKSLTTYGLEDDYFKPYKKYYLCSKVDGTESLLVPAHNLYELVTNQEIMVLAAKNRSNISPEVKAMAIKVKLVAPHGTNYDLTELYDEDYVSPADIKNKYYFK